MIIRRQKINIIYLCQSLLAAQTLRLVHFDGTNLKLYEYDIKLKMQKDNIKKLFQNFFLTMVSNLILTACNNTLACMQ